MTYGECCAKKKERKCKAKEAYAQIKLVFADPNLAPQLSSPSPYAEVSAYAPHCGVKHAELVKIYPTTVAHLLGAECIAYKIKVAYDDCYFACGFVPNLQVTTCAPDEHTFNALVRPLCSLNNNQHAFFRVDVFPNATCYPACDALTPPAPTTEGIVEFNILATQGAECTKY